LLHDPGEQKISSGERSSIPTVGRSPRTRRRYGSLTMLRMRVTAQRLDGSARLTIQPMKRRIGTNQTMRSMMVKSRSISESPDVRGPEWP
jgi:hypothetical protein